MKKVIKNVLFIVLMQVAFNTSGSTLTPDPEIVNKEIDYNNELKTAKAVVKNAKGKIIYEEMVNVSNEFKIDLELSTLQDGFYSIELDKDSEINVTSFVVVSNQVILNEKKSYSIFKPFLRIKGTLVYLSRLSFEKKHLNVKVFDVENNLIYSEQIKEEEQLERIYDFSQVDEKKIKIVLTTEGRKFIQTLEL